MGELPTGTVSFLFTDIEGSSRRWQDDPGMSELLARHDAIVREAVVSNGGSVLKHTGDGAVAVFPTAVEALCAALAAQRRVRGEDWSGQPLRVRMAVHTGEAVERDGDYFGPTLNRAARLMEAAHGGQILVSLATEEVLGDRLPAEVSLVDLGEHRLRDLSRPERMFGVEAAGLATDLPPPRTLEAVPNNLPVQLSSFVGRERELVQLGELLADHRLVTLTGVGGTGKTRLALEYGARAFERFPDGVHFVELATVTEPSLVAERVAAAIRVQQNLASEGSPVEHLASCLRGQRMLLIFDNCEHVIDAAARVAEGLLQGCTEVSLLATSREALGIDGEQAMRVPSLELPDGDAADSQTVATCESARLFIERAQAAVPDFEVSDFGALGEVCRRLDGVPLAIELAAARVGSLSLSELLTRLDDQFRLLTGGRRTAVERHQTLRAAIDWSYDLLEEDAQLLLPRLGVFSGSWSLDGAEAVCSDDTFDDLTVIDALSELVDKSMVVLDHGGGRYRMVEPIRQYALERLTASGGTGALRHSHAAWIEDRLALTSYKDLAVRHNDLDTVLLAVAEYPNVIEAVRWLLEHDDAETAARILAGTWLAVLATGRHGEALELTNAVLADDDLPCWVRYLVQTNSVRFTLWLGDVEGAQGRLEEASTVGAACPDVSDLHWAQLTRGLIAMARGGLSELSDQLEAARVDAMSEDDRYGAQYAVYWLGWAASQDGDFERAIELYEQAYEPIKHLPIGWVPYVPAFVAANKVRAGHGDVAAAVEEAESVARAAGDPWAIAWALAARAAAGPAEVAHAALDDAMQVVTRHGLGPGPCLEAAAWYTRHRGDATGMTRVLGAFTVAGSPIDAFAHWRRWATWAQECLGERQFTEAFEAGVHEGPQAVIEALLADATLL